jgi:hypothetical protein
MNRRISPGPLCVLTLIAAASAGAASNDACALLTPAEISVMLGAPVNAGEALSPAHREFCSFNEAGKPGGAGRNVHITILSEKQFTLGKTPVPGIEKTPEGGLGDDAYWSKVHRMVYVLSVKRGSSYIRVQSRTN